MSEKPHEIDDLLKSMSLDKFKEGLREKFEFKLLEMGISQRQALEILGVERKTLIGILDGTLERVNFISLIKLATFLEIPREELIKLFMDTLTQNASPELNDARIRRFILDYFDLSLLKKQGFIKSTTDFKHIEKTIVDYFGYDSIFDYNKEILTPAFSAGKNHKPNKMVDLWVKGAFQQLKLINNFFEYDRPALVKYFPTIRWQSQNVEKGLYQVQRSLFKMGITLIFRQSVPTLQARGLTLAVNDKPCIVLTDYKGFYPTLWFSLLHELHHVLYDWDEIQTNSYHISAEPDLFTPKEEEANKFARDYLFPESKMAEVRANLNDEYFIEEYAYNNHVHPSIIYAFHAHDLSITGKKVWARYQKYMPDFSLCLKALGNNPWQKPIKEVVKHNMEHNFNIF